MKKTDYFGTFLQTFNARTAGGSSAPVAGGLDVVLSRLRDLGGSASLKDLLPATGNSLDGVMAAVNQLVDIGMAQRRGTEVALTDDGTKTASTLTP